MIPVNESLLDGNEKKQIVPLADEPQRSIERRLKQLRDEGKVEFRGAPKTGGYWPCAEHGQR